VSVRIAEIGVEMRKLWLKQGFKGLICEKTELPRVRSEETRD